MGGRHGDSRGTSGSPSTGSTTYCDTRGVRGRRSNSNSTSTSRGSCTAHGGVHCRTDRNEDCRAGRTRTSRSRGSQPSSGSNARAPRRNSPRLGKRRVLQTEPAISQRTSQHKPTTPSSSTTGQARPQHTSHYTPQARTSATSTSLYRTANAFQTPAPNLSQIGPTCNMQGCRTTATHRVTPHAHHRRHTATVRLGTQNKHLLPRAWPGSPLRTAGAWPQGAQQSTRRQTSPR
jgi:hypothetical protein